MSRVLSICNELVSKLKTKFPSIELSLVPRFDFEKDVEKSYLVPRSETTSDLSGARIVEQTIEIGIYHVIDNFTEEAHFNMVESIFDVIHGLEMDFCSVKSVDIEHQFIPDAARDRVLLSVLSVVCVYALRNERGIE